MKQDVAEISKEQIIRRKGGRVEAVSIHRPALNSRRQRLQVEPARQVDIII